MRFGSLTSLSSTIGSLGFASDIGMLEAGSGVARVIDALSRSCAALHHMVVTDSVGVDRTPDVYREAIRANLAGSLMDMIGELAPSNPLRQGYISPIKSSPRIVETYTVHHITNQVILTCEWRNKRFWLELMPDDDSIFHQARRYHLTSFGFRPTTSKKESVTDCVFPGFQSDPIAVSGSSLSVTYEVGVSTHRQEIVSAYVAHDILYILTWNRGTPNMLNTVAYTLPDFGTGYGFYSVLPIETNPTLDVFPQIDAGVELSGPTPVDAAPFRRNGSMNSGQSFLECSHFLCTAPQLATLEPAADKLIIATLVAARMNQSFVSIE